MKNNLKKQFIWNTLGSGFYSFNSLFFMMIVTRINGVSVAGVFNFCFATSCIFYAIALYSGRTYQVTETKKALNDNVFILNRLLTTVIMIIIAVAFSFINSYSGDKLFLFVILCTVKAVEAFCDVFHGIFQKNNRLDIAGKSMFFRCMFSIILFFVVDFITKNIIVSSLVLLFACLLFLVFIDIPISRKYNDSLGWSNTANGSLKLIKLGFFAFGFSLISNYLINAPRYALDAVMESKYQAIFGIIVMPASIIYLINQFALQPMITAMKENFLANDKKKFQSKVYILFGVIVITSLLSMVFLYLFGAQLLKLLYGVDVKDYIPGLIIILVGAGLCSLANIMSNALTILRKTSVQFVIYVLSAIFAYFISKFLIKKLMFDGAVFSYTVVMLFLFLLYLGYYIFTMTKIHFNN
ncbi:MAG: hypothetical protein J5659_07580 [Clostridia bacterium]|nr:hypothetical protein [Clostridia bacterium]